MLLWYGVQKLDLKTQGAAHQLCMFADTVSSFFFLHLNRITPKCLREQNQWILMGFWRISSC
jgi:hypothetical protein